MVASAGRRPLRVLHLVPVYDVGGMEVGITKLVNGADPARIRGAICSFTPVGPFRERLNPGVPLFELRRRGALDVRLVAKLRALLARERFDIVHTHAWGTLCEGYVAARLAGVPRIVHGEHGTMELRPRNLKVQGVVWRRFDRVLSVSERLADRMAREVGYPRARIQTIRNGLDLAHWAGGRRDATRAALGASDDDVVVLAVGRLVPVKNHRMLIDAIGRTRQAGTRCRLLIAGDGPLRADLEQHAVAQGLAGSVGFLGARADVPELLAACDVFALSSLSEGMSNTVIEAMAAGRPVVATDVGGNSELVIPNETGLLVPSDDAGAMADRLGQLVLDRVRREAMGRAGAHRANREFSLRRMLDEYQQMYEDVAAAS